MYKMGDIVRVVNSPYSLIPNGFIFSVSDVGNGLVTYRHPISGDWCFYFNEVEDA